MMLTDTPCASRWVVTLAAACRQRCNSALKYRACDATAASGPSLSALANASAARTSCSKGRSASSSGPMRRRSWGANAAARMALTSQVIACNSGLRQSSTPPARAAVSSAASRASVASSMAASQSASSSRVNSRANSAARSSVSGVPGSRRRARRSPTSPHTSRRAVKPESANSEARSVSRQNRDSRATMRWRGSGLRSSMLSRWRSRSTGRGVSFAVASSGPWRSHCTSRTSHTWRSGRAALGSAALSSAVRSQAARPISAARWCRPARTQAPATQTTARLR